MNKRLLKRIAALKLVVVSFFVMLVLLLAWPKPVPTRTTFGVTFSAPQAEWLNKDWKKVYQAILNDLQVKNLRLIAFWDEIEPEPNEYNFENLDYQMNQAAEHNAEVVLAIGRKLPRWPECHQPEWTDSKSEKEIKQQTLKMLTVVVNRYKDHPALSMWQLENEPFLDFGHCPPADPAMLRQEERLVRSLDNKNPILITDSGELNWWIKASSYGDVLGTTMYRTVHSQRTDDFFSYDYIFPAWLYRAKARLVKLVNGKEVIISELQGEPWGAVAFTNMSPEQRLASFSPQRFKQLKDFAQRTQLGEAYWWGVEYWYWEKESNGNDQYWQLARQLF